MMCFVTQYYLSFWAFKNVLSNSWHPLSSSPSPSPSSLPTSIISTSTSTIISSSSLHPLLSHWNTREKSNKTHTYETGQICFVIWTHSAFGSTFKIQFKAFYFEISRESIFLCVPFYTHTICWSVRHTTSTMLHIKIATTISNAQIVLLFLFGNSLALVFFQYILLVAFDRISPSPPAGGRSHLTRTQRIFFDISSNETTHSVYRKISHTRTEYLLSQYFTHSFSFYIVIWSIIWIQVYVNVKIHTRMVIWFHNWSSSISLNSSFFFLAKVKNKTIIIQQ